MHRKQNTDLIPADTELERTLRSLRKTNCVPAKIDESNKLTQENEIKYYILGCIFSKMEYEILHM